MASATGSMPLFARLFLRPPGLPADDAWTWESAWRMYRSHPLVANLLPQLLHFTRHIPREDQMAHGEVLRSLVLGIYSPHAGRQAVTIAFLCACLIAQEMEQSGAKEEGRFSLIEPNLRNTQAISICSITGTSTSTRRLASLSRHWCRTPPYRFSVSITGRHAGVIAMHGSICASVRTSQQKGVDWPRC